MPIYSPTGFLDVTNATLRGSKIVTTSNVGVANLNPLNTLSVGSNLQVEDTGSNVLTIRGNAAATAMTLGVITLAPTYSLEVVSNIGNTVSNTVQFTNDTTGFVSTANIEVGTNNLFVDTTTGEVTVGNKLNVTDAHASNLTVASALYANAATGRVGVNTTNPGDFALDVHGSANVGALTANSLVVTGNLAVAGEITSIRSTTVTVDDPIIGLANNNTTGVLDIGFVMQRPDANVAIVFDESSDTLEIGYTQSKHTDTTITMDDSSLFHTNIHGNVSVSNLNIGQFSVVAAYGLDHVTNENNSTGDTIISTNGTTGLQTTANVDVGRDALVSGNVVVSQDLTVDTSTFHVDSSTNRVGVLTTSPGYDLDVHGSANVGTLTTGNLEVSGNVVVSSNLEVGTANLFVDTTTGNVGIGMTDPGHNLDIVSEMNLRAVSNTASIKYNSNVVTEYVRSKKLIKYPRVAMTAATSGGYVASASSENWAAWRAFDNTLYTSYWEAVYTTNPYPATDGVYTGGTGTVYDTNGYEGEYIQIQLPEKIRLYGYSISNRRASGIEGRLPKDAKIFGSLDGSTWIDIHTHYDKGIDNVVQGETRTFGVYSKNETYYNYFRLAVNSLIQGGTSDTPNISDWSLYGIPEYDPEAHGTDVIARSVPNVPNTDWLEVYYDAADYSSMPATVNDKADGDNDGTPSSDITFDTTWKAFTFYGNDNQTSNIATTITTTGGAWSHSASCWFKLNEAPSALTDIYSINPVSGSTFSSNAAVAVLHSNFLYLVGGGNDVKFSFVPETNTWYHICHTYPGGGTNTIKWYLNGIEQSLVDTGSSTALDFETTNNVLLGSQMNTHTGMNGSIANFRLFNRALTADEIWQLYAYQKEYFQVSPDVVTFKGGRLGIGTEEPKAVLDVRGNIMADAYYGLSDSTVAYKYFDSDTVNYTFSNLNLTVGEAYKIIWSYHNTTANHHVHMFVNGDETDTNYWHAIQQVTSTFDSTGSTGNTAKMFSTGNNSDHIWVYDLRLTHDGYPMMMGHGHFSTPTSTMSTGANQSWRLGTWYHNAQTSVITSLKFDQTSSGSFGAGSYIRILKTL